MVLVGCYPCGRLCGEEIMMCCRTQYNGRLTGCVGGYLMDSGPLVTFTNKSRIVLITDHNAIVWVCVDMKCW